jgi:hypothetical protein
MLKTISLPRQARDNYWEAKLEGKPQRFLAGTFVMCFLFQYFLLPESMPGEKTALFEPFIYKNDQFTKTGSGQTSGNLSKKARFVDARRAQATVRPLKPAAHDVPAPYRSKPGLVAPFSFQTKTVFGRFCHTCATQSHIGRPFLSSGAGTTGARSR